MKTMKNYIHLIALSVLCCMTACSSEDYTDDPIFDQEIKTELVDKSQLPEWLADISRKACLSKDTLSLAPLFLHKRSKKTTLTDTARIISAPFSVPGIAGYARYACSAHGLLLVEDNKSLVSGATIKLPKELGREKDAKSGAIIVRSAAFGHTQTNKVGQAASKN